MVMRIRMKDRRLGGVLVLGGLLVAASARPLATPSGTLPAATASPILNLRLTVSTDLPGVSRSALIKETESIWREAHIELRWLAGSAEPGSGQTLRVLVTPRAVASTTESHQWAVGELLRFDGRSAIAVASITGAQRIVNETRQFRLIDQPAFRDHRLGVVLGRAVAHEIGHYVLGTNTHAPYGLMRAAIDAREFADLQAGTFRLDREAQAHLAARAGGDTIMETEFSYSSQ
jgi:hypothetical protein